MEISFLEALFKNPLLLTAVLAGFAASIIGGIVGTFVVAKRISFIAGSVSHSVLGGMGLALWLQRVHGWEDAHPILGAICAGVVSAWLIGWIHLRFKEREDAVIAAVWSFGMAVGVIFISQTPGYNVELTNFLVGNILWVSEYDLYSLLALDFVAGISIFFLYPRLQVVCFDEDQAVLQKLPVKALYIFLLSLIALTVVLLIQVVGVILVMTMLTIPAAFASFFSRKMPFIMALAVFFNLCISLIGMWISFNLDWPAGATIGLFAGIFYLLGLFFKRIR